ncbi:MAG: S41 family peptidase [Solirubrobacterales bacterium]
MSRAWAFLATALVALVTGIWIGGHPQNLPDGIRNVFVQSSIAPDVSASDDALGVIERYYFRETEPAQIEDASIRGMVSRLRKQYKDRFSHYFDAEELATFNEAIQGSFSGVGMTVGEDGANGIRIGSVFSRSPAARAGLKEGDVIVEVDGDSIIGLNVDLAVANIRGPEGTDVTLGVRVQGKGQTRDFRLTRAEISPPITSTRIRQVGGRTLGYVRLSTFSDGASFALGRAVKRVREKGAEGIVLDLRANGGGLLPEAVLTSSLFVPKGDIVVETRSRTQGNQTYKAVGGDLDPPPMVVLVNRDTASAAEILAAALQTSNNDPVVGTRTYGKGVFQQVINLDNGGALDLTVGEFLTAEGVSLAGKGLKPDVFSPSRPAASRDLQLDRAFKVLGGEVAATAGS